MYYILDYNEFICLKQYILNNNINNIKFKQLLAVKTKLIIVDSKI